MKRIQVYVLQVATGQLIVTSLYFEESLRYAGAIVCWSLYTVAPATKEKASRS